MTLQQFANNLNRQPFQPFTLVVAGGKRVTIDAPEFACIDRWGKVITFNSPEGFRREIDCELARIEATEAGARG